MDREPRPVRRMIGRRGVSLGLMGLGLVACGQAAGQGQAALTDAPRALPSTPSGASSSAATAGPPAAPATGAVSAQSSQPPLPAIFDHVPVTVYRGVHTIYHSDAPLPSAAAPRPDDKLTLVWFSETG